MPLLQALVNLSRFMGRTFALWIVVASVLGCLAPTVFIKVLPYIGILLGVVMFGMGLTLNVSDFKEIGRRPFEVLLGILGQYTIMPFLAWAIARGFNLPPELAVGLILLGCCPGGTASNVVTFLARGDVALSVTITSCTTLLAPIVTPFMMLLLADQWIEINPMGMFVSIVQIVLVPVVLGILVNRFFGRHLSTVQATLPLVSVMTIMLIAAGIMGKNGQAMFNASWTVFAAVIVHNGLGMALGFVLGKFARLNYAKCKTLTFEVGMQNSGLGVALSAMHFAANPLTALPSTIGALWHNISGPLLATYWQSRRDASDTGDLLDKLEAQAKQTPRDPRP